MARRKTYQKPEPKEENGLWKVRYRQPVEQPDGTIRREQRTKCLGAVSAMTLSEARKERDRFLQPINDVAVGIEHGRKTMAMLVTRWTTAVKPTLKFSTQSSYDWALKRILPAFGDSVLTSIGRADVQVFLTGAGKSLAPESVRDLRRCLRGLFSVGEEWGWMAQGNPAAGRLRLPERVDKRPKVVLWPEQFWALASHLRQPYRTLVILAVLGGLRRGELAALRWNDNLEPGKVIVDEACYWGKADKQHNLLSWRITSPKTKKSRRTVAIGPTAQQAINEWRSARESSTGKPVAPFTGPDDFMFAIRTNTPIDLHTAVGRHIAKAATAAKVPRVSWHDLRHTYTTWGRLAGMKPEIMRDQLGHSSVLMTLDVYSHASQTAERAGEVAMIEQYATAGEQVM
jgi:integrase